MDEPIRLSRAAARRFLLQKQGLWGPYRFIGKAGALKYVRQAGCIQFDPVDVCGKNPELVLQSRVRGFTKEMLAELLYRDRALVDYFDKNLSIFPMEELPYFERYREQHRNRERGRAEVREAGDAVLAAIRERGPLSSADLDMDGTVDWYWNSTRLSRAALERLYFTGALAVHHKKGAVKVYDLAERCLLPEAFAPDPLPDDHEHRKWRVLRRVGSVGLLWNRASDAWLNIGGLNAAERNRVFLELCAEGKLLPTEVEGLRGALYARAEDAPLLERAAEPPRPSRRCELLAPLDNLLWDRKLIRELFGFDYKWEIYTPQARRKYGHYTLPLLDGERFAGRAALVRDRKTATLRLQNLWLEEDARPAAGFGKRFAACLRRFAKFNGCAQIDAPGFAPLRRAYPSGSPHRYGDTEGIARERDEE